MSPEQQIEQLLDIVVLALNDVKPEHTAEEVRANIISDPECLQFFQRLQHYVIQAAAIAPAGFTLVPDAELEALRDMAWQYAQLCK